MTRNLDGRLEGVEKKIADASLAENTNNSHFIKKLLDDIHLKDINTLP